MYGQRRILKWVFCGRLCDIFTLLSWRIPRVEQNHAAGADCVNLDSNYLPAPVFHSLKPTCISAYCIDTYYKNCILVTPSSALSQHALCFLFVYNQERRANRLILIDVTISHISCEHMDGHLLYILYQNQHGVTKRRPVILHVPMHSS